MKQTLEEAAKIHRKKEFPDGEYPIDIKDIEQQCENDFIAGAEWQSKQSPWTLVGDMSNPIPNDKPCLLLLEDGSVVEEDSNWEDRCLLVVAWMLKPSFDQILEANKDVLQRMKEKGD